MNEEKFIGYVGDYKIHDSRIKDIICDGDILRVCLVNEDGENIVVKLLGVESITSNKPKGMILYAIAEMVGIMPFHKFIFINTDEEGDATLEVVANQCIIG